MPQLTLKDVIDTNNGDEEDVLNLKKNLQDLGYYQTPDYGMTGYTDEETFKGIKKFQNDNGLTADGVLKPGGETETALNERLKARESRATANNEHDSRLEDLQNSYQGKLQRKNLLSDSQQAQRSQIQRRTAETEEDTWGKLPEKTSQKPLFEQKEPAVKPATSPSPSLQPDNLLTSETDKIDGRMQQLHEKYRDTLVRRNLLASNNPAPAAQKPKSLTFEDVYNSEYDDKGNLVYKGTDLHEGGYSNRKEDRGGRTNFGIKQQFLEEYNNWQHPYRSSYNMPKNVEDLTHEQAKTILKENTYQRYGIDKISDKKLARQMFDQVVNPGPGATIPTLQREINKIKNTNLPGTDIVGKQTQAILNTMSEEELRELRQRMTKNRLDYYFQKVKEDSTQKANLNGWLTRACGYFDNAEDCEPYRQKAKQIK